MYIQSKPVNITILWHNSNPSPQSPIEHKAKNRGLISLQLLSHYRVSMDRDNKWLKICWLWNKFIMVPANFDVIVISGVKDNRWERY